MLEGAVALGDVSGILPPQKPRLNFLWLELTNRCNLRCGHCYTKSSPNTGFDDALDLSRLQSILDQGTDLGCRKVQFIGGEPTISSSLARLVRHAEHNGYQWIEIFSNLVHLNDDLLDTVAKSRVQFSTSFYTHDPKIHARITGSKDSFIRTTTNIRRLLLRGISVRCNIVVFDDTKHDLQKTQEYLRLIGVEQVSFDYVREVGRGASGDNDGAMSALCGECWKGKLCISARGDVYTCVMARSWPVGNILRSSLEDIFFSDRASDVREDIAVHFSGFNPYSSEAQFSNCGPWGPCGPCGPHEPCGPHQPCGPLQPCGPNQPCGPLQPCGPYR